MQMNMLGWGVLGVGGLILLVAGIMAWTGGTRPVATTPTV